MYINKQEAARFLKALDPGADVFTFQVFDPNGNSSQAAIKTGTLKTLGPWLEDCNKRGLDVYVTVNETDGRGRRKANIRRARAVWLEDDGEGKSLPLTPHIVVETSEGHSHKYLRVNGDVNLTEAEGWNRTLALNFGGDKNAIDYARVLRMPGFYNHKRSCPVRLAALREAPPYHAAELRAKLGEPLSKVDKWQDVVLPACDDEPPEDWLTQLPEDIRAYLTGDEVVAGNEDDHKIAKELLRVHPDSDWVWDTMSLNLVRHANPEKYDRHDYKKRTLQRAWYEVHEDAVQAFPDIEESVGDTGIRFPTWMRHDGLLGDKLDTAPPPRSWFAKQRLLHGRGHLLTGIGGSSKTTMLYQLAIAAVIGRLLWSWGVEKQGRAVLFLTEDEDTDLWEMVWDVCRAMLISDEEKALLRQRLHLFGFAGTDVKLLVKNKKGVLEESSMSRDVRQFLAQFDDLVFIGIDPAVAITEGDEQDQIHQRKLGWYIDSLAIENQACGMLLSHSTKGSTKEQEITSHQSRGGGAITDAVRGEFTMRTMTVAEAKKYGITGEEERKSHVQLVCTKGNRVPPAAFVGLWLYRGDGGVLHEVELEEVEGEGTAVMKPEIGQAFHILSECVDGLTGAEWKERLLNAGVLDRKNSKGKNRSPEAIKQSFYRVTKGLEGVVEQVGDRWKVVTKEENPEEPHG
jgi:hypothetical protein